MNIDIWILHKSKEVFVTDIGGVPAELIGYVSDEASSAAASRGYPTVSEIGFPADCHLTAPDWGEAMGLARQKAGELGYAVKELDSFYATQIDDYEGDDDEEYWDGDWDDTDGYPD